MYKEHQRYVYVLISDYNTIDILLIDLLYFAFYEFSLHNLCKVFY